jgi:hypothetical protein
MLKSQESLNTTKGSNQNTQDEELYQRLFKKIARDFIYHKDLDALLEHFYTELLQAQQDGREMSREEMRYHTHRSISRALQYKNNLSLPKHKRKTFKDVTDE